jgi:hypothetical protein
VLTKIGVDAIPLLLFMAILHFHRVSAAPALLTGSLHLDLTTTGMVLTDDILPVAIAVQLCGPFFTLLSVNFLREGLGSWRSRRDYLLWERLDNRFRPRRMGQGTRGGWSSRRRRPWPWARSRCNGCATFPLREPAWPSLLSCSTASARPNPQHWLAARAAIAWVAFGLASSDRRPITDNAAL